MHIIPFIALGSLVTLASAHSAHHSHAKSHLKAKAKRSIVPAGGWSLSMTYETCPVGTLSCFTDQTGNKKTQNREENCCPAGTTPELFCGTYVNTGQPYACCPINNPDCRGDVEASDTTDICANSGWALWHVPYGGGHSADRGVNGTATTLNSFCCLPDHYGYYFPRFGQDAVGQCTNNKILPNGALPAVQDNNGDGSVDANGVQLTELPKPAPTVAPTCDLVSYGWSVQKKPDASCQAGFNQCNNYAGACCPTGLNCGTVVGDSEVPVCCPPENPDCRGDVEGLWPQLCADSSWALWYVNTNGNHFCCLPGQVGYNIINDNTAVGYCGSFVPNGTMRSILDYEGDGSNPGSYLQFPCDTNPAPNNTYSSMSSAIVNPPSTLNPGIPLATALYPNATSTTQTITSTKIYTVTSCPPTVTNCPLGQLTTEVVILTTTFCPGRSPTPVTPGVTSKPLSGTVSETTSGAAIEAASEIASGSVTGPAYEATGGPSYGAPAGAPTGTSTRSANGAAPSTAALVTTKTNETALPKFTGAASIANRSLTICCLGFVAALFL